METLEQEPKEEFQNNLEYIQKEYPETNLNLMEHKHATAKLIADLFKRLKKIESTIK